MERIVAVQRDILPFMNLLRSASRRDFLTSSVGAPLALSLATGCGSEEAPTQAEEPAGASDSHPVGLELYSVREALADDLMGTVARVAEMGYEAVEFYRPYYSWTPENAGEVRTHMDNLGIRCLSTHNPPEAFMAENYQKSIELNSIIGSQTLVMASPPRDVRGGGADAWNTVADLLTGAQEAFSGAGIRAGYHNHQYEWQAFDDASEGGPRFPMDILANETPEGVTLQLDVGTCLEMEQDPVAWINAHPGRIRNIHCKDWAPGSEEDEKGYRVLLGEGTADWAGIIAAAESVGGIEFYLIEQEGSRYDEFESARRCLETWREMRS